MTLGKPIQINRMYTHLYTHTYSRKPLCHARKSSFGGTLFSLNLQDVILLWNLSAIHEALEQSAKPF